MRGWPSSAGWRRGCCSRTSIILGGLNEGSWPPDPGHDPWLSRPMLAKIGLPPPEQAVGFAAHDFVQGLLHARRCSAADMPSVVLTRARRAAGAPTVPSRWLQRLDAVLEAAGRDSRAVACEPAINTSPSPAPPISARSLRPVRRPEPSAIANFGAAAQTIRDGDRYLAARSVSDLRAPCAGPARAAAAGTAGRMPRRAARCCTTCCAIRQRCRSMNCSSGMLERGRFYIAQRANDPGFWDFWWPRFDAHRRLDVSTMKQSGGRTPPMRASRSRAA